MYGYKIILKVCQRTDVTNEYIQTVLIGDFGEKAMRYCVNLGRCLLKKENFPKEDPQPDILDIVNPKEVGYEGNRFV